MIQSRRAASSPRPGIRMASTQAISPPCRRSPRSRRAWPTIPSPAEAPMITPVSFYEAWRTKKLTGVIMGASAGLGNAAARLEAFVISSGTYAYGGYPDIDELFRLQAQERDRRKREVMLHQIQKLMYERVMYAPIFEPASLHGIGPRVDEPAVGLNALLYFAAPYEEMRQKRP